MKEVWRPVKGFEGLYEVSNTGKVRSLTVERVWRNVRHRNGKIFDEIRKRPGRVLKPIPTNNLLTVHLYTRDHVRAGVALKRVVAEAFMPDFNSTIKTHMIRHKDNKLSNCNVENLYIAKNKKEG